MNIVYLLGNPQPWMGSDVMPEYLHQEPYRIRTGEERGAGVTEPEEPVWTEDDNEPVQFEYTPTELYHTNRVATEIRATDPDGIVDGLGIEEVQPDVEGFVMPGSSPDRTYSIGGTTTATLLAKPTLSPGSYGVTLVSNPASLGERVTCAVPVEVHPITIERLRDLITDYHEDGDVTDTVADKLYSLLNAAEGFLKPAETTSVESLEEDVLDLIESVIGVDVRRSLGEELEALLEAAGVVPSGGPEDGCSAFDRVIEIAEE